MPSEYIRINVMFMMNTRQHTYVYLFHYRGSEFYRKCGEQDEGQNGQDHGHCSVDDVDNFRHSDHRISIKVNSSNHEKIGDRIETKEISFQIIDKCKYAMICKYFKLEIKAL